MRFIKLNIFLLLLFCINSFGQNKIDFQPYSQFWGEVDITGKIKNKLRWQFDVQYSRQGEEAEINPVQHVQQLMIRPWIHFYPKKTIRLSLFGGLYYNYFIQDIQREFPEYRTALQATFYSPHKNYTLINRFRFEDRNIKDQFDKFETAFRARYMLKLLRPLNKPKMEKGTSYLVSTDEVFGNCGSQVTGYRFFNQNRFYIGYGYNLTDDLSFEAGYVNQLNMNAAGNEVDVNHVISVTFFVDNLF